MVGQPRRARYVAVDFDGTIVEHTCPGTGRPNPGAIDWMKRWDAAGAGLILWTMRSGETLDEALEYLDRNSVPLFSVNHNPTQVNWTESPKAYAHIYVDDAAFGCPLHHPEWWAMPAADWNLIGPEVLQRILHPLR